MANLFILNIVTTCYLFVTELLLAKVLRINIVTMLLNFFYLTHTQGNCIGQFFSVLKVLCCLQFCTHVVCNARPVRNNGVTLWEPMLLASNKI